MNGPLRSRPCFQSAIRSPKATDEGPRGFAPRERSILEKLDRERRAAYVWDRKEIGRPIDI